MILYMHNVETSATASAPIQSEGGEVLYVEPCDLPPWANACSAQLAVISYDLDGDTEHQYGGVAYIVHDPSPAPWARLGVDNPRP